MSARKGDLVSISEFGCCRLYNMQTLSKNDEPEVLFGHRYWHMREKVIEDIKQWIPAYVLLLLKDPELHTEQGLYFVDLLYADKRLQCIFDVSSKEDVEKILTVRLKGSYCT